MDRYNMHHNEAGQCLEECVEPYGEWVTYDDAMAEINNLTARLNLYKTVGDDSEAKISELTAELTDVVLKNEKLMAEIAELKRSYQILCDKYDAMEMCDNKIGADAIQKMLDATGHGLNPDWLKHFRNYADKLRGKK
ncbi:MAG: hypothetical protein DRQ35_01275 [Gammaproteobacteria bacterium]|nr:MAG: hypothetical protein DRQ35_01275 [Gammaproteobacteria bacterium]